MNSPDSHRRLEGPLFFLRFLFTIMMIWVLYPAPLFAADLEITGFKLVQGSSGNRWEIRSGSARYDGDVRVILSEVEARVLDQGSRGFAVSGKKGEYLSNLEELTIEKDVVARTGTGYTFRAPEVKWVGPRSEVQAGGGITLSAQGLKISGRSMIYDIRKKVSLVTGDTVTSWTTDLEAR
jgi:hypothetical protein